MVWDPALDKYLGFGTLKTAAIGKFTLAPCAVLLLD